MKIKKKKKKVFFLGGGGVGLGGQGECDRRIEVLGKIHQKKKKWGGGGVDVNEELNFF